MQTRLFKSACCLIFILFSQLSLRAQTAEEERSSEHFAELKTRYMRTGNRGELKDFAILTSYFKYEFKTSLNDWLSFGVQTNALFNYGTNGIKADGITGSGPIYEGNLWNRRLMTGSAEVTLPQIYAEFNFGAHQITAGQFLRNTPLINAEPWPLPNALQGLWYKYQLKKGTQFQLGAVFKISSRFSGDFVDIGESISLVGVGVDATGNPAQYRGNVESDMILIANAKFKLGENGSIDIWNYFVENVTNTFLIEPSFSFGDGSWKARAMYLYQSRVNNGGNDLTQLAYTFDKSGSYLGARFEKGWENNKLQFNFSRIGDQGRVVLPREWGGEPFYTFQRRTRIEGNSDVTTIMVKWERSWDKENAKYRFFTSAGQNWMPDAFDAPRNKRKLPSHLHLDASFKYEPKGSLKNLSVELYAANRFLTDEIGTDLRALINRADFWHFDFIVGYKF